MSVRAEIELAAALNGDLVGAQHGVHDVGAFEGLKIQLNADSCLGCLPEQVLHIIVRDQRQAALYTRPGLVGDKERGGEVGNADLFEGETAIKHGLKAFDPKLGASCLGIVLGDTCSKVTHVEMRGGNDDKVQLLGGLLGNADGVVNRHLGLAAKEVAYALMLREGERQLDVGAGLGRVAVIGTALHAEPHTGDVFIPEVVGDAERVEIVLKTVFQNAVGALMQVLRTARQARVNVQVVVDLIAHKATSFNRFHCITIQRIVKGDAEFFKHANGALRDAKLTKAQQTLVSEVVAMQMEETFGNEAAIKRLVGEKPNLAKQILSRIKAFLQTFGKKSSKDPEAIQNLRRTEELFRKALQNAGVSYAVDELTRANAEKMHVSGENGAESVDESGEVRYNKRDDYTAFRGWADGVLSEEDRRLLREKISEADASGFEAHPRLSDGCYLFDVNNKIVLVTGDFNNPVYDGVIDINTDNATTASTIRKDIENATNGKGCTSASFLETVEDLYGEAVLMVYNRGDWVGSSPDSQGSYPTRPAGYKDFGYSAEQRYGRRGAGEGESAVTPKEPSIKPVSQPFTDITGKKRAVLGAGEGRYMVDGSIKNRNYIFDSPDAAIEAENKAIVESLARRHQRTPTWVRARLNENPAFFEGRVLFSRKSAGGVVTISEGEMAKLHANYAGDKVFDKKSVSEALGGVEAFKKLPAEIRNEFINRIWTGYNQRLHQQGFEQFTEIMWNQLHATIMQEVGYDEQGSMTEEQYAEAERVMDEQIVAALHQIVASGKPSIKAKLEEKIFVVLLNGRAENAHLFTFFTNLRQNAK